MKKFILILCISAILVTSVIASPQVSKLIFTQSTITVEALRGPMVTDLTVHVPPDVTLAKKIQVKAYYPNGTVKFSRHYSNVTAVQGVIPFQFDDLLRGDLVNVTVQLDKSTTLDNSTVVLLRPDLVVSSVNSPGNILVGDALHVTASVQEANGDLGANAAVELLNGETVLDAVNVSANAGGAADAVLSTTFLSRGEYNLNVKITRAVPAEYNETNNNYPVLIRAIAPDIAILNVTAPSQVIVGDRLDLAASISELYGEVGANATVGLFENDTLLDSKVLAIPKGGRADATLSSVFTSRGNHNLIIKLLNTDPADYDASDNAYPVTIRAVAPDAAILNVTAPSRVTAGERLNIMASISELYGEVGANVTVSLLEGSTLLESKSLYIQAGGQDTASFSTSLSSPGNHSMVVKITSSAPQDSDPSNNEQAFAVSAAEPVAPIESMAFSSKYYYQNTTINTSHYLSTDGYVDSSVELLLKEDEALSFSASSNRTLSFPVDRVYLSISGGSGNVTVYEETNLTETEPGTFRKFYPELNATLTLVTNGTGTTVALESKSNYTIKDSQGYLYWWYKGAEEWNTTSSSGADQLTRATDNLLVRVEIQDGSQLLGGNAVTSLGNRSYTGGWTDTTEGRLEQSRSVAMYSGRGSGDTVP